MINKAISLIACFSIFVSGCTATAIRNIDNQLVFVREENVGIKEDSKIQLSITENPEPSNPNIKCEVAKLIANINTTEKIYQQIDGTKMSIAKFPTGFHIFIWTIGLGIFAPAWGYALNHSGLKQAAEECLDYSPGTYRVKHTKHLLGKDIVNVTLLERKGPFVRKRDSGIITNTARISTPAENAQVIAEIEEIGLSVFRITDTKGECNVPIADLLLKYLKAENDSFPVTINLKAKTDDGEDSKKLSFSKSEVLAILEGLNF